MTDIARRIAQLKPAQRALLQQRLAERETESTASATMQDHDDSARRPTSGEERLWFLDQLDGPSALYNISIALDITGVLDEGAVERALQTIVRRHEPLRTRYTSDAGALRIVVDDEVAFALRVEDLRVGESSAERGPASMLEGALNAEASEPFALDRDPMLRAVLYRVAERESTLQMTLHHIAADGWSLDILRREFAECYNAAVAHREARLPDLTFHFADYARWMREPRKNEMLERSAAHWADMLRGSSAVLDMPTDRPRPKSRSLRGLRRTYEIAPDSVRALHEFARDENATPFMVLLAALFAVVHRYTGEPRIVIGTPMGARMRADTEGLIGFFANTVPLPGDLSEDPAFRALVQQVRETALDAYTHQEVPIEKVVQQLNPERDYGRSPLVDVMFTLERGDAEQPQLDGLATSARGIHTGTSKFDLTLQVNISRESASVAIEYNSELFEPDTIDRLYSHFDNLLRNAIARPDDRISAIPIIGDSERDTLLRTWNATALDYPRTTPLAELIEAQVERTPDATAIVFGGTVVTYRELNERANQLARELVARGARPGSLVGLYVERSAEMMIALLAIIKAGAGYVPLEPAYPKQRIEYMIADSGIDMLVTQRSLATSVTGFGGAIVAVDDSGWADNDASNLGVGVSDDAVAYIIYTSGSTGKPKGARIRRRGLTNILWTMRDRMQLTSADRWLAITTISFDFAVTEIWLPWLLGAPIFVANREATTDMDRLRTLIHEHDITVLQATPTTWDMLFTAEWQGKGNLRCLCGGEKLSQDLAARLVGSVAEVWNVYGPTETTVWSTTFRVEDADKPVLIGRPAGNTRCYILDRQRQLQPIGVAGELYIAGDGLAEGYQNRPELTRERFIRDPFDGDATALMYRTGDLARYHGDGNIEWLGRADDQVKVRGFRIELGEIEETLRRYDRVRQAFVAVRDEAVGGRRLVAYIAVDGEPPSASDVRAFLKQTLPDYMVPAAYVMLESLPLMANGKVDRQALPEPRVAADDGAQKMLATNPVQDELVRLWQELLNVEPIGITDDFFELGGHSLLAAKMVARVAEIFQTRDAADGAVRGADDKARGRDAVIGIGIP